MALYVYDGRIWGTWKEISFGNYHINDSGTWKEVDEGWINDGGTWKLYYWDSGKYFFIGSEGTQSGNTIFKNDSNGNVVFETGGTDGVSDFDIDENEIFFRVAHLDQKVQRYYKDGSLDWEISGNFDTVSADIVSDTDGKRVCYVGGDNYQNDPYTFISKIDKQGNIEWTLNTDNHQSGNYLIVKVDENSNVFYGDYGYTKFGEVGEDSSGNPLFLWSKDIDNISEISGTAIKDFEIDSNYIYIVTEVSIAKLTKDSDASVQWKINPDNMPEKLNVHYSTGNVYISENYGYLTKYDSDGNQQWRIQVKENYCADFCIEEKNEFIYVISEEGGAGSTGYKQKYEKDGNLLWTETTRDNDPIIVQMIDYPHILNL